LEALSVIQLIVADVPVIPIAVTELITGAEELTGVEKVELGEVVVPDEPTELTAKL
jgi:hypothetical protein